ncbi:hypothetical protein [uncultured Polaribacter sp.]|uniref:hypothetical protein n=1 Tax=uncultured Polaribacter sp. TaxID=174711 RepID=UPI0030DD716A|tara:strand:+ start:1100 stop:1327 length:228 start_codon:yes stop_codon:yes gene_type:complete
MKLFKKVYWLIYPLLIIVFMSLFDLVYTTDNVILKIGICSVIAFILSPRRKIILTQTGRTKQITWMFLKEPISID